MKTFVLSAIALAFTTQAALAQKNIDPTPEDITLAKKLREAHSKNDVAVLSSIETISFSLSKDGKKVMVDHSANEKLMNINHRADIQKYEFYDSESEIDNFTLKYRNDKKAAFLTKDEFYKSDDLFYNDARVKYMSIDFPVQGYTYSYELSKKYKDIKYFTSLYFNDEFPVVRKEINITVPDWLDLEIREFNFAGKTIQKTKKALGNATIYTFVMENVDARIKEEDTPGPSYLYPHLVFIAKSYKNGGTTNSLFASTADLYKWYKSLVNSIDEQPDFYKDKVAELTAKAKNDDEKIKNIYYWVQDNIRYIAFEDGIAGFKPEASQNVYKNRYGDCKGMANLMRQMLKQAGFDARLTWIGTKHIAYDYTTPSLIVDNHMICTLFRNGKKYFLDGTEKYNSFGEYAERIQGKEVMIEDGDKYIIEKVPVAGSGINKETFTETFRIENEKLVGKAAKSYLGESRSGIIYQYNSLRNDKKDHSLQNYLSGNDKNYAVSNIITSDLTNRDEKATIAYDVTLANRVSTFDNEMYIDLDYHKEFTGLDFRERKTDFEFSFKQNYESATTLEIPAGYKVSKLPTPLALSEKNFAVTLSCEQKGNSIIYKKHFDFKSGSISSADFATWNAFMDKLKKTGNEQIILTKI